MFGRATQLSKYGPLLTARRGLASVRNGALCEMSLFGSHAQSFYKQVFPQWEWKDKDQGSEITINGTGVVRFDAGPAPTSTLEGHWIPTYKVECVERAKKIVHQHKCKEFDDIIVSPSGVPFRLTDAEISADQQRMPPVASPDVEGLISWLDLLTAKGDELRDCTFFADVMGWRTVFLPNDAADYVLVFPDTLPDTASNGAKLAGAVCKDVLLKEMPEPRVQRWLPLFHVVDDSDVDKIVERAVEAGGRDAFGMSIPTQDGRVAMLADPAGVPFGLFNRIDRWDEVRSYD